MLAINIICDIIYIHNRKLEIRLQTLGIHIQGSIVEPFTTFTCWQVGLPRSHALWGPTFVEHYTTNLWLIKTYVGYCGEKFQQNVYYKYYKIFITMHWPFLGDLGHTLREKKYQLHCILLIHIYLLKGLVYIFLSVNTV